MEIGYMAINLGVILSILGRMCKLNAHSCYSYMLDPIANLRNDLKKNVLGGETAAWSELVNPSNLLTVIFPRASAAAEALWSAPRDRDWKKAANRMDRFVEILNQRGIDCSPIWPTYCSKRNCLD